MTHVLDKWSRAAIALSFGVCSFGACSVAAHAAEDNPHTDTMKIELPKDAHSIYAGVGLANELMHVILEKPTSYGNFYARIGQFYDGEGVAALAGYRYPYKLTGKANNGVYVGAFAGHVEDDRLNGERYNRLGGGIDLSYLWFDTSRISSVGVGVYGAEAKEDSEGNRRKVEPSIMFSVSLAAGLF